MLSRICVTMAAKELACATNCVAFRRESNLGLFELCKRNQLRCITPTHSSEPSHNVSPGEVVPIMVSAQHFNEEARADDRILVSALWGLVPRWHKGTYDDHGFNTTNHQLENLNASRMYKPAFVRGKRCVLACEGFYEWQRVGRRTDPLDRDVFYIYQQQPKGVLIENKKNIRNIQLTFIAGIFDVWHDDADNPLYSFTILSMDAAHGPLNWLHQRVPAVLERPEQVAQWLDMNITSNRALMTLESPRNFAWHQVASLVIDSDNKSPACNKRLQEAPPKRKASATDSARSKRFAQ